VITTNGWFAGRPSGTEGIYKIYAESFKDGAHLDAILHEAQEIVNNTIECRRLGPANESPELRPATVQRVVSKAGRIVMRSHSHLEIGFKVWEDQQCWFWLVVSPQSDGGTVGAGATEAEAIRDARSSIETYQRSDCRRGPETGRMNGCGKGRTHFVLEKDC